jgi:thiol-disulfide isomerase/thioredoxin
VDGLIAASKQSRRTLTTVKRVATIEEFKEELTLSRAEGRLLVVKFHAEWCKSCAKIKLPFEAMSKSNPNANFIAVPVTPSNADLHHGLGVPSLPFAHVYHPTAGLVEERRITRAKFREFEKDFNNYAVGSCDVNYDPVGEPAKESDADVIAKVESSEEITAGRIVRDFLKRKVSGG